MLTPPFPASSWVSSFCEEAAKLALTPAVIKFETPLSFLTLPVAMERTI